MKKILSILFVTITLLTFNLQSCQAVPLSKMGQTAQLNYKAGNYEYASHITPYSPFGDYLNSSKKVFQTSRMTKDANGIPMVKYSNGYQYNPVTIAQVALSHHGKFIVSGNLAEKDEFLRYADALVRMQSKDGSLRYNFAFSKPYLHVSYKSGWVSAMAQGQALSVYARAYQITQDSKYLKAGQMAFQFVNTPISRGGTLTTLRDLDKKYKDYFFYEEYISKPNNYTLNGYMFTLLGIYDWSKVVSSTDMGQKEASRMFYNGIKTLTLILPFYDIGGFTSYDLSGITMHQVPHVVESYHAVHIFELYALHSITGNKRLDYYYKTFVYYVK